jgi:hypothetical protein
VTTTRRPNNGRCSNQFSFPRNFTTSPMIVSTGGDSFFSTARPAMVASVPVTACCRPVVPQRIMATGVSGGHAVLDERPGPVVQLFGAHEHDLGAGNFGDLVMAQSRFGIIGIFVAGEDGETGAMLAMGEGNAGVIRRRHDRRNAGHHFKTDFRRRERLGFLAAAPENVRIAALEPHDAFAFARPGDEQRGDFLLRHGHVFAARDEFGGRRRQPEQVGIHQRVVEHHVGAPEQFRAAQREQARVARPGADEINCAFGFHPHTLFEWRS